MSLKEKLLSLQLVIDNEYLDKYIQLIENNRETKRQKFKTQRHHIIPKYYYRENNLEVDNSSDNLINLYYKDHILAHYYLCLCSKTNKQIYQNFITIRYVYNNSWLDIINFDLNSLDKYQELYEQSKKYQSELELGKHLKPATIERKQKISDANKDKKFIYKDENIKAIKQNELNAYLLNGWKIGNPKLSKIKKGKPSSRKGTHTGKPAWNKGLTKEIDIRVAKIGESAKGRKLSSETKLKISQNSKLKRKIYCISTNETFNSISEAAKKFNLKRGGISNCCLKKNKTCGKDKYQFRFLEEMSASEN